MLIKYFLGLHAIFAVSGIAALFLNGIGGYHIDLDQIVKLYGEFGIASIVAYVTSSRWNSEDGKEPTIK